MGRRLARFDINSGHVSISSQGFKRLRVGISLNKLNVIYSFSNITDEEILTNDQYFISFNLFKYKIIKTKFQNLHLDLLIKCGSYSDKVCKTKRLNFKCILYLFNFL